jgi:UPF0176 protein
MTTPICNIAAYSFIPLQDLAHLRERFQSLTASLQLKGTMLLSPEGFNCFMAGKKEQTDCLENNIRHYLDPHFTDFKRSFSEYIPFKRLLIKIKKEIIAFNQPHIDPRLQPAPSVSPKTLKNWLDTQEPLVLLDTRNDYEYRLGSFNGAITLRDLHHFRDFPNTIKTLGPLLKEQWKNKKIVTFCTGGIRCEKAAPYLLQQGFTDVYQLEGGILKYFEEYGDTHYQGDCFVFDGRVALDAHLKATNTVQCFACRMPVTPKEQELPSYQISVSCPHCIVEKEKGVAQ